MGSIYSPRQLGGVVVQGHTPYPCHISSLSLFPRAKDVTSESQWQWRCKAGSQPIVGNPSAGPVSGFHL